MDFKITSYFLPILLLVFVVKANDTSSDGETRQPRGSGRIVKLYSGVRPDPIICTNEGFKEDPNNCAVFYRCTKSGKGKYTAFKFQCPPGTVYDTDTEVCNHPRSTKRSQCGGMKETLTQEIDEINEIQELPKPISTEAQVYTTLSTPKPSNQFTYNRTTQWQASTTIRPVSTSANYQAINSYPWVASTQNQFSVAATALPVLPKNAHEETCTFDGFMGDSVNCHKFYRCVGNQHSGFTKYEFSCSEPTIWDDDIKSCNHPWAVKKSKCGRSNTLGSTNSAGESTNTLEQTTSYIIPEATTSHVISYVPTTFNPVTSNNIHEPDKTIQNQLQISYGSNVQQTQTQISHNSAIQNQTQINYSDRVNKTNKGMNKQNQSQISYGSAVSQSQTQINYGNEVVQTQLQIDHSNQSSQSQIQITRATTPASKSTEAHRQDVTQKQNNNTCIQSGFIGDSNDCKKFYRCVDNGRGGFTRHDFSCGEGTLWDQTIEACNHAWAVKECGVILSHSETTTKLPQSTSTHSYSTTPIKPSESYYPTNPNIHPDDLDDVGYNNGHATSYSTGSTSPTTENIHQSDTVCRTSGFIGDNKNCQIFYSCVENAKGGYTKYAFKCGEGTLWDSDIGACNHALAVKTCGAYVTSSTSVDIDTKEPTSTSTSKVTIPLYTTASVGHATSPTTQSDDYDTGYNNPNEQPSSSTIKSTIPPQDLHVSNKCQSTGFIADKNDCKKFYRCVDSGNGTYTRYEFTCGEGTAWDAKIEGCNHVWAVDCKNNDISNTTVSITSTTEVTTQKEHTHVPESDKNSEITTQGTTLSTSYINSTDINKCKNSGFMGDVMDCKKFYRCVDNGDGSFIRYEFACGEGTVWDQKIEGCNHAWAVEKCGGNYEAGHEVVTTPTYNVTVSDEEPVHGYPAPEYPMQEDEIIDKTTQKTSISTSTAPSSYCQKDGFIGDKINCKIFYRCVNDGKGGFIKYEFQCGEGTVWDPSIEACNHAWAVRDCGAKNESVDHVNESTTEKLLITSSEKEHLPTENTSSATDSGYGNEITEQCKKEGFFADRRNCNKFYRCVSNGNGGYTKYEFTCGEGTYWNQIIQACDHTTSENTCKDIGDDKVTKQPHHENDEAYTETTTKGTIILTTESQGASSTEKFESTGTVCHSEGFYGDQYDCQRFYRCVSDGKGKYMKYKFTCGDGTVWDEKFTACVHKSESNSCSFNVTESSSQANFPSNENSHTSSTPNIPHQTPENVNVVQQTSTEYIPSESHKCTSEGFHANSMDCKKFIRCVDNGDGTFTKYDFVCGEGTVWVQELLACDHDDGSMSCHTQIEWTTKAQTNLETSTHSNTPSSSTTAHTENTDKDYNEITKAPQVLNEDCQSEGFFANKDDCKKYYRCVPNNNHGYTKHDYICGEGTAWDATLQTCNYDSANNNCQGTYKPDNQTESIVHDEISETTESSTSSTTQKSKESTNTDRDDACKNEGFFGSNEDCTKFYRCVDNGKGSFTKYDFTCGEGTIWDQDILTCNHPHDVVNPSCNKDHGETSENSSSASTIDASSTSTTDASSSSTSNTTQSSSSTTTQSSASTSNSTESSSNCTHEETSKNPSNKNVTCTKAGYYPDPNDCKKFYRCVDWDGKGERFSVYFFECGEGTIWDPALDTCNHEESVYPPRDCSNKPQNISSGQESTTEQVTTQESTTSEKTTTESFIENTTSQQPTTSEKTTTELSTTSEQTTTQQPTSTETTTIEHSTATEQSTTLLSTSEGTTTLQVDNTTEQTTTTDSVTTEKTTQETTTIGGNTTDTTTVETTTQYSTTEREGSTTEAINSSTATDSTSTTEVSTTEEPTFNNTTTEASELTSTTESQNETTTENNSSSSSCPDTDDDQYLFVCPTSFRRHPKYCNLFYQCTEDNDNHEVKIAVFKCPNNTIYDESKIKCVEEDKADKKCDGEISSRSRIKRLGANYKEPIVVTKDAQKCLTVGHTPFERNSECSPAFLKCEKTRSGTLRGFVHRCPQNYMYWSISRRCEREEVIRDCKRTINNWNGRWEIPIDRNNVAW